MAGKNIKLNPEETLGHVGKIAGDNGGSLDTRPGTPARSAEPALSTQRSTRSQWPLRRKPKRLPPHSRLAAPNTTPSPSRPWQPCRPRKTKTHAEITEIQSPDPRSGHHRGLIAHRGGLYGEPMRTLVTRGSRVHRINAGRSAPW